MGILYTKYYVKKLPTDGCKQKSGVVENRWTVRKCYDPIDLSLYNTSLRRGGLSHLLHLTFVFVSEMLCLTNIIHLIIRPLVHERKSVTVLEAVP